MILMVSSRGMLVNNDLISKVAIVRLSELKLQGSNLCTKENVLLAIYTPEDNGRRRRRRNFEILLE